MLSEGIVFGVKCSQDKSKHTYLHEFAHSFWVRCPSCNDRALVSPTTPDRYRAARLTCAHCGTSKDWPGSGSSTASERVVKIGSAVDWYFHLPLWLATPCCGKTLWAYNADHLRWLEGHVRAQLRESTRSAEWDCWANSALASRLPRWMVLARNRDAVLRGISKLERRLP